MKQFCALLLVGVLLLYMCAYASDIPEGTYVCDLGGFPFYLVTFEGDEAIRESGAGEQERGNYQMDGDRLNISFEDGSTDWYIYDSQNDTLDFMGAGAIILEKSDEEPIDHSADSNLVKIAIKNAEYIKKNLKAPDTMILKEDVHITPMTSYGVNVFTITYTAQNSFGVPLLDTAVFLDNKYLAQYDQLKDLCDMEIDYSDAEEASKATERRKIIMEILFAITTSESLGACEIVSGEDVAKELGIEFRPD